MEINKDGRTLYFSDEEIDNETNGQKKVFVTKRINGKESHHKAKKPKKELKEDKFNFNDEIVIGVNIIEDEDKSSKNKSKNKPKKKNKKIREKKKHRKNINKKVIAVFSTIIIGAIVVIFSLTAPIFNITKIEIIGNSKIATEEIKSLSGLKIGENIFKFNNSVSLNIKQNPYVETAEIERVLPGTVKIKIKEREVKYQINLINSYAYIDKFGYILENSTVKKEITTIVGLKITEEELLNKPRLEGEDIETLNNIVKITEAAKVINIDNIITEINTENENDYILFIESEAKKIYIGDSSNLTNKMLYIQKILENEKGKSGTAYVNGDMASGFKPYFREE